MNNMIVFPLILPIMTAILLVFFRHNIILQRIVSIITMAVVTIISAVIVWAVPVHGILRLDFSG